MLQGPSRCSPDEVVHRSTVTTATLHEASGARTAFVATWGFEDLLELARQNRPKLYAWHPPHRKALVRPEDRHGLRERTVHDGSVLETLEESEIVALTAGLADVESVAVWLLHSYANCAHERRLGQALRGTPPGQMKASSSGTIDDVSFGGRLPEQGRPFSYYETISGGMDAGRGPPALALCIPT